MNQEIKLFRALLQQRKDFFESNGYFFEGEEVHNEGTDMEFFQIFFHNSSLDKVIIFSFSPSKKRIGESQISASIRRKKWEWGGIGLSTFLAYKELNRRIYWKDQEKYFFTVDPQNLEETIHQQLDRIIEILSNEMKELFTTETWMSIPIHDPRDDY